MIAIAHAGHWVPYLVPVLIVAAAVVVAAIRERRARRSVEEAPRATEREGADPGPDP